jgi:hypothetical protein
VSIATLQYSPDRIADLRQQVRGRMLSESPYARQPNFIRLSAADLVLLYRLYDQLFFTTALQPLVMEKTGRPLALKVSGAMTSSGGRTLRVRHRDRAGITHTHYEIAISARLLFNSFKDNDRPIHVSGQLCADRLDAMMRIMEHELVHLIEMLTFGDSSCKKTRFLTIADGVVRAQGRKIIFSTNLPNVGDLDEALIRPGRCFARLNIRALKPDEAQALVRELAASHACVERGLQALAARDARNHSLAEVYRCLK